MHKTVVIDVVGLSSSLIGEHTPFLKKYCEGRNVHMVKPMLPAVTTSVQSTYLTGKWPDEHGIVGNGWYDRIECEVKFWKQSNKLVLAEKIWEKAKKADPGFTCANMFWWYNMYSSVDYSVTPRPNYLADGRKIPDCYSHPASLRDELQNQLGQFPLFQFWGPGASIKSSQWIADASMITDDKYDPTLTLIYLPHLDYCLQRYGQDFSRIKEDLNDIDGIIEHLVTFYQRKKSRIIILSEYGITSVDRPIHVNRILRENGFLNVRLERGRELLDVGASTAFAVADHQVAHIYCNDVTQLSLLRKALERVEGIERILDKDEQQSYHLNHERSGDLVLVADERSWFTYYFWMDDAKAPDYARTVDIHKKPGYDPVEMFMTSKLRAAYKLFRKKAALRYVMDVIPLDATLIKGSHGRIPSNQEFFPVLISDTLHVNIQLSASDVHNLIWQTVFRD